MRNRIAFALYVGPCWELLQVILESQIMSLKTESMHR